MVLRVLGPRATPRGVGEAWSRARRLAPLVPGVVLGIALAIAPSGRGAWAAALGLLPDPPTIAPAAAADHLGEVVVVETQVGPATVVDGRVRLAAQEPDAAQFEIYVVPPIVGPSASEVATALENRRVRAVGRVHEFGGRLQLVVVGQGEGRIVALDGLDTQPDSDAAAANRALPLSPPPTPAATELPPAPLPSPTLTPATLPAPAPPPPPPSPPPPPAALEAAPTPTPTPAVPVPSPSLTSDACVQARVTWELARTGAREPVAALDRCLATGQSACRAESERARSVLAELGAAAERMAWLCPDEGR